MKQAPFSSEKDDEYSSAYYKEGLVFCSNRRTDLFVTFSTPEDKELFNMFYVPIQGDSLGKAPAILSVELMTNFNDGPACFGANDSIILFSRNNEVNSKKRDTKDDRNKLGIFTSHLIGTVWNEPKAFEYNSKNHHITMPSLSKDGSQLFFVSDMSGGFGGLDIYMCEKVNNTWSKPINLGNEINTKGNESFPFISASGELFFASNGHKGLGGLDIFSSIKKNGKWQKILPIKAPINSEFDDFGLITDCNFESGYFSSNRKGNDDIYEFRTKFPQFSNCDTLKENQYCFLFYDEYYTPLDTLNTYYEWVFGDGMKIKGKEAEHCYEGPGNYEVELNIIDKRTGEVFLQQTKYEFELLDFEQAYISCVDESLSMHPIKFEASKTNLPTVDIANYYWDFGDGFLDEGIDVNHYYNREGDYKVILGILSEKDSLGCRKKICVEKTITINDNPTALIPMNLEDSNLQRNISSTGESFIGQQQINETSFRKSKLVQLPSNGISTMKAFSLVFFESFEKEKQFAKEYEEMYEDFEHDLNSNPAKALALKSHLNSRRKSNAKMHLIEKELQALSSQFQCSYIEAETQTMSDSATPILNRLLKILLTNPLIELKIGVHISKANSGNFDIAGKATQLIADYLVERGVDTVRLRTAVYETTFEEAGMKGDMNRLEFKVIKE
ncbi:hypothetical protein BZG02_19785 [Labilibaculum filiforme]|uniref:PKD domain-containing protein n=1 Tax=Labilibaculum filiforme TaxID=1940526 RepID=A0A2N3HQN2_9BACT|nr:hypothetical protein BZG02_19785 [Labilibaculum filiforme]